MSRLLVISNRVRRPGADAAQGGLAVALGAALRANKGLWFGWSGERTDRFTGALRIAEDDGIRTATVDLEDQDIDEYYNGYANRTLWPLFHYRIDLAEYDRAFGAGYERVNNRLADTVAPLIEPDDLVWVHDYHLIPLGFALRKRGIANRMGFFLHIPWPPTRLLVSLPHHRRLVESLFAYDVIGFQTAEWLESFRHFVEKEMGGTVDGDWATVGDRRVQGDRMPHRHRLCRLHGDGGGRDRDHHAPPRLPLAAGPPDAGRRRPARLFQGAGGAVQRLGPGAARPAGMAARGGDGADRAAVALRRRHLPGDPRQARFARRTDQRGLCRRGLDADPLRQPRLSARRAGRHLPRRPCRPRHPLCATA